MSNSPDEQTDAADEADAVARALATFSRAELAAPLDAVRGYIDLLIEDAARQHYDDYAEDLGKMKAAGERLAGLVDGVTSLEAGSDVVARSSRWRHDLRTPIAAILGYGDLLAEQARDDDREPFAETLDRLLDAARRLLEQVDAFVGAARSSSVQPSGAGSTEPSATRARHDAVEAIRAILVRPPDLQPVVTGSILVVDDDPSNLDLLSRRLDRDGHAVTALTSGQAALDWIETHPVDLVLCDLIMPGLTGIDVLSRLRAREETRVTPVIVISGLDEAEGAIRCIEAGADDYLSKPVDAILLRARINAALERKRLRDRDVAITRRLQAEQTRAEDLLHAMLPRSIVERLRGGETVIADHFDAATILFCDIVGFTGLSARLTAGETLDILNAIFSAFDRLAAEAGVEKIKTIGDGYMVAGGLPEARPDHAAAVAGMALRMPAIIDALGDEFDMPLSIRVGLDTGPVAAGIIGRNKFSYDVWGDTVNTASRMEHHGVPGRVHITGATRQALGTLHEYDVLAPVRVKGKGLMQTYLIRMPA